MKYLVQILWRHALDRLILRDEPLRHHVHRDADCGQSRSLGTARLQHEHPTALERELDVLDVPEMALELRRHALEVLVHFREFPALELADGLRGTSAGDDVFSLRVGEHVAVQVRLAAATIAREGDARAGVVTHVAIDHGHDVDGRPQVVGDAVHAPVVRRAAGPPALEHGRDRAPQLRHRILGEGETGLGLDDGFELPHQRLQVVRRQVDVTLDLAAPLVLL